MLWHLSFFILFCFFPALSVNTKILSFVSFTESIAVMVPDTKAQRPGSMSKSIFDFYPFHMNMCAQLEDRKRGKKHSPSSSNIYAWMPLEVATMRVTFQRSGK